ncbi:MAG TPA: NAD-dependent epimerase/dehydratase family protein [Pirellulales bacterium]|nr:NAD-dependent epimerase/dehydratase family protein [Pirellulales bacterium]
MKILITGLCGFVGSSVALRLRECRSDITVVGIDNFSRPGSKTNRSRLEAAGIKVVEGDVTCSSTVDMLGTADWIIHAAAIPTVMAGVDNRTSSRELVKQNLLGALNLLEHARNHRAGFILLSSSRVYNIPLLAELPLKIQGEAFALDVSANLPVGCSRQGINELFSTAPPASLYGASKLAAERLALEYGQAFGFPVIINRCGVLAGGTQFGVAAQGIFSFWVRAYAQRRPLQYIGFDGAGHQVRDALHPHDLADLLALQMLQTPSSGEIWNVGGGLENAMSLAQLSHWCQQAFGPHTVESKPQPRPFDVAWIVMDSRQVEAAYRWRLHMSLPSILEEIAEHHRKHPEWLDLSQSP